MEAKIEVGGLAALSRGLRAIDDQAPKELRLRLNAAANILVDATRPKIPSKSGAARRSLVARSTRTSARIAAGGKKARHYPWLDFGGQGRVAGRPAPRTFISDGRYIYPTLREKRPQIEAEIRDGLTAVIRSVGLQED